MKILLWQHPIRKSWVGKRFTLIPVRWHKTRRRWEQASPKGSKKKLGFLDPTDGHVVALKYRLEHYGRVIDMPDLEEVKSPDISAEIIMGTPSLGVSDDEEE